MFACSDKDDDSYRYPLKVGNTWTMLRTLEYYDIDTEEMVTQNDTIYIEVAAQIESPNGELCYRVENRYASDPAQHIGYDMVVNRDDGIYQLGWKLGYGHGPFKGTKLPYYWTPFSYGIRDTDAKNEEVWLSTPKKILPSKCEEGLYWTYGPNSNHLEAGYLIMPQESVTVPNGTYKCHVRKSNILELEEPLDVYDLYARDGQIKFYYETVMEYIDEYGNLIGEFPFNDKIELMSCDLN
jgi:hypothetical protein